MTVKAKAKARTRALPQKKVRVGAWRPPAERRGIPPILEEHLEAQGLVLRLASKYDNDILMLARHDCVPFLHSDLPGGGEKKRLLLKDIRESAFTLREEDGTFGRGDLIIYVQPLEARTHFRNQNDLEAARMRASESELETLKDADAQLRADTKGLASLDLSQWKPPETHVNPPGSDVDRMRQQVGTHLSEG